MIRPYRHSDKSTLIEIMHALVPSYFAATEIQDFKSYLEHETEYYFVFELGEKVIASAGINILEQEHESRLSWDLVHPEHRGVGIGSALVKHRIAFIKENFNLPIIVRTSQMAHEFYQKQGFELLEIRQDFWAEGFDLYEMKYRH